MTNTILSALHKLTYIIFITTLQVGTIIIPILQRKELKHREV